MILSENFRRAARAISSTRLSDLDTVARTILRGCADRKLSEEEAGLIAALEGRPGHAWLRAGLPGPDDRVDKPVRRLWQA